MKAKSKLVARAFYYQKYLGLFLIIVGVPILISDLSPNAEFPLMIGLFTVFTGMEKVEDERSVSIKTSSLYIAFILGYAVNLLSTNLYTHRWIPVHLVRINHFVILVFALAVSIYYLRMHVFKSKSVE
jgi:hypothetical protein